MRDNFIGSRAKGVAIHFMVLALCLLYFACIRLLPSLGLASVWVSLLYAGTLLIVFLTTIVTIGSLIYGIFINPDYFIVKSKQPRNRKMREIRFTKDTFIQLRNYGLVVFALLVGHIIINFAAMYVLNINEITVNLITIMIVYCLILSLCILFYTEGTNEGNPSGTIGLSLTPFNVSGLIYIAICFVMVANDYGTFHF